MSDRSMSPPPVKLFLSYSRQDYPIVQDVYAQLNRYVSIPVPPEKAHQKLPTYQPWLDMLEIKIASQWQAEIQHGLDTCDAVLLIASQYSLASNNVRDEWLYALAKGKPVYVWLIDNAPPDPKLAACPRFDLRADPLDDLRVGRAIDWLGRKIRALPEDPAHRPPIPWETPVLPAYVRAHRRMLTGLQIYTTLIQFLIFWPVMLSLYGNTTYFVIGDIQISPLLTAPLAILLTLLDWAIYVRQMRRLPRRWLPYEHLMLYWLLTAMLKLVIPLLIALPLSGPLILLAVAHVVTFLVAGVIARRKSPLVMRSRSWRSNAEAPAESAWFPVYPVHEVPKPAISKRSRLPDDPLERKEVGERTWPRHILILYDPWDAYFGEYLAVYYADRVSHNATVIARPVADCADALPAAERLYLIISPHSVDAMAALVERPEVQARQFVLIQLQDVDMPDALSRYQWIDARSDYRRAFQQVGLADTDLPTRPPARAKAGVLSLIQPHPRAVFFSFLAIGAFPVMFTFSLLVVLYLGGINLVGHYLPAASSIHVEKLALEALLLGLVLTIIGVGYWRRRYSLRLILAAWIVFFFMFIFDDWTSLVMLILGAPIAFGLVRWSRLPHDEDGVLDGFEGIEMLALGIWQPKKRFEWPLFLLLILLSGVIFLGKIGTEDMSAALISWDTAATLVEYSGPIEVVGLSVGEAVARQADGSQRLSDAGTRFSALGQVYALLEAREIPLGSQFNFQWSLDGERVFEQTIPWELEVDWTQPDNLGQLTVDLLQLDGTLLPAGDYTLTVLVGGAYLAERDFTIVP